MVAVFAVVDFILFVVRSIHLRATSLWVSKRVDDNMVMLCSKDSSGGDTRVGNEKKKCRPCSGSCVNCVVNT